MGIPVVNIGDRQRQRERGTNVVDAKGETAEAVGLAIGSAVAMDRSSFKHPFGRGEAGAAVARALAAVSLADASLLRKRWHGLR